MLRKQDLPFVVLIAAGWLCVIAVYALFMQRTFNPDLPYWKEFSIWLLVASVAWVLSIFVVRPLQGKPPIFPPFRTLWRR